MNKITGDNLRLQYFRMTRKALKSVGRRPRTDAQRNRERILEVAKEAFARSGANTSLDDVAKLRALERELCTVTLLRGMPFSRPSIGLRLKS